MSGKDKGDEAVITGCTWEKGGRRVEINTEESY